MRRNYKTGLVKSLTGIYLVLVSAFLTLALDQAIFLTRLYNVSVSHSPAIDYTRLRRLSFSYDLLILAIIAVALFLLVRGHPRRLWPVSIMAGLIFVALNLYSGRHVFPQLFIWPTPTSLAEQYTQALAAGDLEAALRLTGGSQACETKMGQIFQADRGQLLQRLSNDRPELSVKNVSVKSITTFYQKPVPQRFSLMQPVPSQLVTVMATAENGQTIWLNLKMRYPPLWGTRYICGQAIDD